jgi:hypothetical protein
MTKPVTDRFFFFIDSSCLRQYLICVKRAQSTFSPYVEIKCALTLFVLFAPDLSIGGLRFSAWDDMA